jgi:hypothetical protein
MAKREPNIIARTLDELLRARGFSRRKKTWYLDKVETVLVVDLQKSDFSRCYYINLGVSPRQLCPDPAPKINICPIGYRLEMLVREHELQALEATRTLSQSEVPLKGICRQLLENPLARIVIPADDPTFFSTEGIHNPFIFKALDLEDETVEESQRVAAISDAMAQYGLPFLFSFESMEKIKGMLRDNAVSPAWMIWASVYDFCGIPRRGGTP